MTCRIPSSLSPQTLPLSTLLKSCLKPNQQVWNKSMKEVRVSLEWIFGDIRNYFTFLDFKKELKISLSSVVKMYILFVHYYITHAQFFTEIQHHNILKLIHLR